MVEGNGSTLYSQKRTANQSIRLLYLSSNLGVREAPGPWTGRHKTSRAGTIETVRGLIVPHGGAVRACRRVRPVAGQTAHGRPRLRRFNSPAAPGARAPRK